MPLVVVNGPVLKPSKVLAIKAINISVVQVCYGLARPKINRQIAALGNVRNCKTSGVIKIDIPTIGECRISFVRTARRGGACRAPR